VFGFVFARLWLIAIAFCIGLTFADFCVALLPHRVLLGILTIRTSSPALPSQPHQQNLLDPKPPQSNPNSRLGSGVLVAIIRLDFVSDYRFNLNFNHEL